MPLAFTVLSPIVSSSVGTCLQTPLLSFLHIPSLLSHLLCAAGWQAPASQLLACQHRLAPGHHWGGGHCCASAQWQKSSSSWVQTVCRRNGKRTQISICHVLEAPQTVLPSRWFP